MPSEEWGICCALLGGKLVVNSDRQLPVLLECTDLGRGPNSALPGTKLRHFNLRAPEVADLTGALLDGCDVLPVSRGSFSEALLGVLPWLPWSSIDDIASSADSSITSITDVSWSSSDSVENKSVEFTVYRIRWKPQRVEYNAMNLTYTYIVEWELGLATEERSWYPVYLKYPLWKKMLVTVSLTRYTF